MRHTIRFKSWSNESSCFWTISSPQQILFAHQDRFSTVNIIPLFNYFEYLDSIIRRSASLLLLNGNVYYSMKNRIDSIELVCGNRLFWIWLNFEGLSISRCRVPQLKIQKYVEVCYENVFVFVVAMYFWMFLIDFSYPK